MPLTILSEHKLLIPSLPLCFVPIPFQLILFTMKLSDIYINHPLNTSTSKQTHIFPK